MSKIDSIKDIIEMISLTNGEQYAALRIFDRTPLRKTSYIIISSLDEMLRFNITNKSPQLYYWDEYEKDDGSVNTRFKRRDNDERVSIQDLLSACDEFKYYVEKYFPHYTI